MAFTEDDRHRLHGFLEVCQADLQALAFEEPAAFAEAEYELRDRAWSEVRAAFAQIAQELDVTEPGSSTASRLQSAGLTGPSLQLKLGRYDSARVAWRSGKEAEEKTTTPVATKWRRQIGKHGKPRFSLTKRIFRVMNNLLGSLATVFAVAELIKEYKESAEDGYLSAHDE